MALAHEIMLAEIAFEAVQVGATLSRIRTTEEATYLDRVDARQRIKGMRDRLDSIRAALEPRTPQETVDDLQDALHALFEPMAPNVVAFPTPDTDPQPPRAA